MAYIDDKWKIGETKNAMLYGFEQGSKEWLAARCIGASTMLAVMGGSKYQSKYQTISGITHQTKLNMNFTILRGSVGEKYIRDYLSKRSGIIYRQIGMAVSKKYPWMRASPDGIYDLPDGKLGILEIKVLTSIPRCNEFMNVAIKILDDKPLSEPYLFPEHYHQVHYTAGVVGAVEITYAVLICGYNDISSLIVIQTFPFDKDLFERKHVPSAFDAYKSILTRDKFDKILYMN